jgi:hypothetical protein
MKLFHDAGLENACLFINVNMFDWSTANSNHSQILLGVSLGLLVGQMIVPHLGLELPSWIILPIGLFTLLTIVRLLWFTFHPKEVSITVKQDVSPTTFMVAANQILWATPVGDVPVFRNNYQVKKEVVDGSIVYTCVGKSGTVFSHTIKKLVAHRKIWSCHGIRLQLSVSAEAFPEAYALLEGKCKERVCRMGL